MGNVKKQVIAKDKWSSSLLGTLGYLIAPDPGLSVAAKGTGARVLIHQQLCHWVWASGSRAEMLTPTCHRERHQAVASVCRRKPLAYKEC